MSLALFRSELRSAVRAAQSDNEAGVSTLARSPVTPALPRADLLRRVAKRELNVEGPPCALGERA